MIVLGTDPGIRTFGWAAVELDGRSRRILEARTVRTESGSLADRWGIIRASLEELPNAPDLIVYEEQSGAWQGAQRNGNTNAGGRLPQVAVGCVIAFASEFEIPVIGLQPRTIKKLVVGNGNATKAQVKAFVQRMPGCPKRLSEHAADGVIVACAGWLKWRTRR